VMLRQVKCHEAVRLLCYSLHVFAVFAGQKHPHFARQPLQKVVRSGGPRLACAWT
jgi:hypothetical protein